MKRLFLLGLLAFATPAFAADDKITVEDAYARSSNVKVGAAFMTIRNEGKTDRLVAARSDIARKVELHTHTEVDGIMRMRALENGIPLGEGETVALKRGGMHVMLMGLTEPLDDGDEISLTLVFESGREKTISVPVDNARKPKAKHHGKPDS